MGLTYRSVEQSQTFTREGVDIVMEHGLAGWASVRDQINAHRYTSFSGPREAWCAFNGIHRAMVERRADFTARHGEEAWAALLPDMEKSARLTLMEDLRAATSANAGEA